MRFFEQQEALERAREVEREMRAQIAEEMGRQGSLRSALDYVVVARLASIEGTLASIHAHLERIFPAPAAEESPHAS